MHVSVPNDSCVLVHYIISALKMIKSAIYQKEKKLRILLGSQFELVKRIGQKCTYIHPIFFIKANQKLIYSTFFPTSTSYVVVLLY